MYFKTFSRIESMKHITRLGMLVGVLALTQGYGLGFGSMGQVSSSMGGAGVALKNSAFGLYYNPALLSASPKVKFGYSAIIINISHSKSTYLTTKIVIFAEKINNGICY